MWKNKICTGNQRTCGKSRDTEYDCATATTVVSAKKGWYFTFTLRST